MSHSALLVLLVALAVTALVNGARPPKCQGKVSRPGQWGGVCFGTEGDVIPRGRCDAIIANGPKCDHPDRPSCCVQCYRQNKLCQRRHGKNVVSRNLNYATPNVESPCCKDERVIGRQLRPGSTCHCCKHCKPKRRCRRHGSRCITKYDPVYNEDWCGKPYTAPNGKTYPAGVVKKRQCHGRGCWCCKRKR